MAELFWLNDAQWAAIAPLLPKLDTRINPVKVVEFVIH